MSGEQFTNNSAEAHLMIEQVIRWLKDEDGNEYKITHYNNIILRKDSQQKNDISVSQLIGGINLLNVYAIMTEDNRLRLRKAQIS
jgi:hypothetical protein